MACLRLPRPVLPAVGALALVAGAAAQPARGAAGPAGAPAPSASVGPAPGGAPAPDELVAPVLEGAAVVPYPEGARGDHLVMLRITVGADGLVEEVSVAAGEEPFASAATAAARGFRFVPARRGAAAVRARIRFEVRFVEPLPEPPDDPPSPPPAVPGSSAAAVATPPPEEEPLEVVVEGERTPPGRVSLTRAEVRQLPGAFGDPFRAVEILPGVTPIFSGLPYFFVRGAPPGNVGYFLDGIRVPLLYHIGLGPSVVHPGIVERVDLYPGGYPARFGGFAGGIVAGETRGPMSELHGEAVLRLVDAGALVEAPFDDGNGTALVGGRYSYTGLLLSLLSPEITLEYWDYQVRTSYQVGPRDELMLFAFGAFDYLGEDQPDGSTQTLFSTEFHRVDLRHAHRFDADTRLSSAVTVGLDRTRTGGDENGSVVDKVVGARTVLDHRVDPRLTARAGAAVTLDVFSIDLPPPDPNDPGADANFERLFPTRADGQYGVFGELAWDATSGVTVLPGLRVDLYSSGEDVRPALEPRLATRWAVTPHTRLNWAFGVAHQPPSFAIPIPGFAPSDLGDGLQQSLQSSWGAEWDLPARFTLAATVFHAAFLDLTDGILTQSGGGDEVLDTRSLGSTVGAEVIVRRDLASGVGGYLGYTLSRSQRATGRDRYPATFDRTHVANAALAFDLGRRWRTGFRGVFYTGIPVDGRPIDAEGDPVGVRPRAPDRLPPFYRLDVRIEKQWPLGGTGYWAFVAEVLNATLTKEVTNRFCDDSGCQDQAIGPVTIPSLGVEAVF